MMKRPGGELASRPLHFIWIADSSGSMSDDGKIQALNTAIREAIPHMKKVAEDNPNAQVLVRAVKFSNGAQWHISPGLPYWICTRLQTRLQPKHPFNSS